MIKKCRCEDGRLAVIGGPPIICPYCAPKLKQSTTHRMPQQSGRRCGKTYEAITDFINKVRSGETTVLFGSGYVVMSKKQYYFIMNLQSNLPKGLPVVGCFYPSTTKKEVYAFVSKISIGADANIQKAIVHYSVSDTIGNKLISEKTVQQFWELFADALAF